MSRILCEVIILKGKTFPCAFLPSFFLLIFLLLCFLCTKFCSIYVHFFAFEERLHFVFLFHFQLIHYVVGIILTSWCDYESVNCSHKLFHYFFTLSRSRYHFNFTFYEFFFSHSCYCSPFPTFALFVCIKVWFSWLKAFNFFLSIIKQIKCHFKRHCKSVCLSVSQSVRLFLWSLT